MLMKRVCTYLFIIAFFMFYGCTPPPSKTPTSDSVVMYPLPPAAPRIQYLTSFSTSSEFSGPQPAFRRIVFGEEEPLPIIKPYGISGEKGKIYICDTGLSGLEILDLDKNEFSYFIPKGLGQLMMPINCCKQDNGKLYVTDSKRKQVVVFNPDLSFNGSLNLPDEQKPTDVFCQDSLFYVSAMDGHAIYSFSSTNLAEVDRIKGSEYTPGSILYQPVNFTCTDSHVIISDIGASQVTVYNNDGTYSHTIGSPGKDAGQFTRPKGIAADRDGNIYVVDAAFENIQVFNSKGDLLMYFGGTYSGHGGMWLPADVYIDYENTAYFNEYLLPGLEMKYLIWVTNQYGPDKISVYGFIGESKEEQP